MKKRFVITFLILLSVVLVSGSAFAVSGVCSNCHTMHYSQNGTVLSDWDTGGPFGHLLLASCIGCHSGPTGSATNTHYAPIVLRISGAPAGQGRQYTLAGGDFYWVATTGAATDSMGHNVLGLAGADLAIGMTPPGWDKTATPGAITGDGQIASGADTWASQLRCAGQYGCHGNHSDADPDLGILGSHHSNTGGTATQADGATTVGGSYRFLGGINGLENSEWNWNETATVHNEYYGVDGNAAYANKRTISYSCAQCHGVFHSSTGGSSPWLRHPTDIDLPNGEYQYYNTDGLPSGSGAVAGNTDYSIEAPVGRTTVPATSSKDVDPSNNTDDIVLCLSCHRAHGSPEPDILRWTYSGMQAGSGTSDSGCFTCHTTKNAD
jgi:predicted CXXCH cytochrome family protein